VGRLLAIILLVGSAAWGQSADRAVADQPPAAAPSSGGLAGLLARFPIAPKEEEFQPLSSGEKFRTAFKATILPTTFFFAGVTAAFNQATNNHEQFGQGMSGYGKRFAASYADYALGYALAEGAFPALFHQDPRYFRKAHGGVLSRVKHAMAGSFVTFSDSGKRTFNASVLAGNAGAVAVSTAYYSDQRTASDAARNLGLYIGYDMLANIFKEFWPDVLGKLQRK
jgi:hypothetical protein